MKTLRTIGSAAVGLLTLPVAVLLALPAAFVLAAWYEVRERVRRSA